MISRANFNEFNSSRGYEVLYGVIEGSSSPMAMEYALVFEGYSNML